MKAPDKIYIPQHNIEAGTIQELGELIVAGSTEYIRKDALLEWVKKKHDEYKQMDEDFQGDVFIGNRHAFAEVIAKIKSL